MYENNKSGYRKLLSDKKRSKGYTIIELIFAVAIMALLFSVGFTSYRDFQKRQYLENAVRSVKGDLRLAQEYALAGRKPDEPLGNACTTSELNGYIFVQTSVSAYDIQARCTAGDVTIKSVTLPSDVTIGSMSLNPILFQVLGRGVKTETNVTINLQYLTGGVSDRQITVTKGGEIR